MKSQSKLQNLSPEDQQYILDLCQDRRYEDVVPLLAQPRPVGLSIKTSVSALCRFYNRVNPLGLRAEITGQLADGLQIRQDLSGPAFNSALLTLVQVHLLDSLKNGKSVEELQSSFRTLHNLQRNCLAFEKLRAGTDDQIAAIHQHDEAIAENQPDFTEIAPTPASNCQTAASPAVAPLSTQVEPLGALCVSAVNHPAAQPHVEFPAQNVAEPEILPSDSTENPPPFHLFHSIPPAQKTATPSAEPPVSELPGAERKRAA
jgi:hypothetical protein